MDTERLKMAAGRSAAMIFAVTAGVCPLVVAGAGQVAAGTRMPAGGRAAAVGGTWHTAQKVPGLATLNKGGEAQVQSVSCASAGNCSAGGYYTDGSGRHQVFVVSQVNGTWHTAIEVPGTAALNTGGNANISLSCASAGNCSAGGYYTTDSSGHTEAFVVSQVNGIWRTATEVPGTAALNQRGDAGVTSVSCTSAGNCSAGGLYGSSSFASKPFVVSEVNGTWHNAIAVPGVAALDPHGYGAYVSSVSCASAGNCSAGGSYLAGYSHAFVVSEVNGTWRTAIEVPGTAALNQGRIAYLISMSCASAGNCSAGGTYTDSSKRMQAFAVSQMNGTWRTAIEVPGTAALNTGGTAFVESVSCTSPGNCSAGGGYTGSSGHRQAFVVTES